MIFKFKSPRARVTNPLEVAETEENKQTQIRVLYSSGAATGKLWVGQSSGSLKPL